MTKVLAIMRDAGAGRHRGTDGRFGDRELDLLFREARSVSVFTKRPVQDVLLRELLELTLLGPTSINCQPSRFVFVRSAAAKQRLLPAVASGNVAKVLSAPVTVIVGYDLHFFDHLDRLFPHRETASSFAEKPELAAETAFRNGSLQGGYLILAARALGLDAGPISGFDNRLVDRLFFEDGDVRSNFLCNLGYGDRAQVKSRHPRLAIEHVCKFA